MSKQEPNELAQPHKPTAAAVTWHLTELTATLRKHLAPPDAALLRVMLRGLIDLCGLLVERGPEAPARPPSLLRKTTVQPSSPFPNGHVVAEALGLCQTHPASLVVVDEAYAELAGIPSADNAAFLVTLHEVLETSA